MVCQGCGASYDSTFKFCPYCGHASSGSVTMHWEFKEVDIPLNIYIWSTLSLETTALEYVKQYDDIVLRYLQHMGRDGWQPDGVTDITEHPVHWSR
jgi:hypothetical protein